MRFSHISLISLSIACVLASGCQNAAPPPVAAPAAASPAVNPTVACERGCSVGYDACMDGPLTPTGELKAGGHSDPVAAAPQPGEVCPDQLKACLRRCLN